jgi:hypothetical protein
LRVMMITARAIDLYLAAGKTREEAARLVAKEFKKNGVRIRTNGPMEKAILISRRKPKQRRRLIRVPRRRRVIMSETRHAPELSLPQVLAVHNFDGRVKRATELRNVLYEVESILRHAISMGEHEYTAVTLWIAHTYVYQHFSLTPRLLITSHRPGHGKTKLASVIARLSKDGQHLSTAVTGPLLGRIRKEYPGGLMLALDQLDNAFDMKAQGTGALLDKIIAGADRGSKQAILVQGGSGWVSELFDLSFPMVLVKIGDLPSAALNSRCILIQMHPATEKQDRELQRYTTAMLNRDIGRLVRPQMLKPAMLKAQVLPKGKQPKAIMPALLPSIIRGLESKLAKWEPQFPPGFLNRARDKWRPLLTIAEAAGVKWTRRAHLAAMALESEEEVDAPPGAIVLTKLAQVIADFPHPIITTAEVVAALGGRDSPKLIATRLKEVGIKPGRHYRDGVQHRAYVVPDILRAAAQYKTQQDT